jgi:hypothetical protein
MKAIPAVLLCAALLVVAGCGSGSKRSGSRVVTLASGSLMVAGTTTISNVKTGTVIACKGPGPMGSDGPTATVPTEGQEIMESSSESSASGKAASSRRNLRLTCQQNGKVTVSCTR